jgi:hypothetical protein
MFFKLQTWYIINPVRKGSPDFQIVFKLNPHGMLLCTSIVYDLGNDLDKATSVAEVRREATT